MLRYFLGRQVCAWRWTELAQDREQVRPLISVLLKLVFRLPDIQWTFSRNSNRMSANQSALWFVCMDLTPLFLRPGQVSL